uniref:RNase H type-1 domain-containing protein n=1 Tax=Ditylum brightwellii TaxID=49249 RepID=A0A7S4UZH0_9STRA
MRVPSIPLLAISNLLSISSKRGRKVILQFDGSLRHSSSSSSSLPLVVPPTRVKELDEEEVFRCPAELSDISLATASLCNTNEREGKIVTCSAAVLVQNVANEKENGKDSTKYVFAVGARCIPAEIDVTSADAEYDGLIFGLEYLEKLLLTSPLLSLLDDDHDTTKEEEELRIVIEGDCKTVIDQMNQKSTSRKLRSKYETSQAILQRIQKFRHSSSSKSSSPQVIHRHIPRDDNILCDALCQLAAHIIRSGDVQDIIHAIYGDDAPSTKYTLTHNVNFQSAFHLLSLRSTSFSFPTRIKLLYHFANVIMTLLPSQSSISSDDGDACNDSSINARNALLLLSKLMEEEMQLLKRWIRKEEKKERKKSEATTSEPTIIESSDKCTSSSNTLDFQSYKTLCYRLEADALLCEIKELQIANNQSGKRRKKKTIKVKNEQKLKTMLNRYSNFLRRNVMHGDNAIGIKASQKISEQNKSVISSLCRNQTLFFPPAFLSAKYTNVVQLEPSSFLLEQQIQGIKQQNIKLNDILYVWYTIAAQKSLLIQKDTKEMDDVELLPSLNVVASSDDDKLSNQEKAKDKEQRLIGVHRAILKHGIWI